MSCASLKVSSGAGSVQRNHSAAVGSVVARQDMKLTKAEGERRREKDRAFANSIFFEICMDDIGWLCTTLAKVDLVPSGHGVAEWCRAACGYGRGCDWRSLGPGLCRARQTVLGPSEGLVGKWWLIFYRMSTVDLAFIMAVRAWVCVGITRPFFQARRNKIERDAKWWCN